MTRSLLILILGFAALAGGFLVMASAGQEAQSQTAGTERVASAPVVDVIQAEPAPGTYKISASGRLRARQGILVIGEVAGKITAVGDNFVVGARLQEGDLLFRIDQTDYIAAVQSAEAGLESAKASLVLAQRAFARQEDLVASGVISDQANDTSVANLASARAGVKQAEAQLNQARKNLERTEVRAPYPSRIIEETVSIGTYVAPGQQLGTITDTRMGELIAGLTPRDSKAVAEALLTGTPVKAIARPNSGSVSTGMLEGTVFGFTSQIDSTSRTAQVIALFPNAFEPEYSGKIFGDDFMTLDIEIPSSRLVWRVPAGTVRKDKMVWAVGEDNTLSALPVTVLSRTRDATLISAGPGIQSLDLMVTLLNEEIAGMTVSPTSGS